MESPIIQNNIRIPKYQINTSGKFEIVDYDYYKITYLINTKDCNHKLKVLVNNIQTPIVIDIANQTKPLKEGIFHAISWYLENGVNLSTEHEITDTLRMSYFKGNNMCVHVIKSHLLPINKEINRDKLTEYGIYKPNI